jgi:hypothetical protein
MQVQDTRSCCGKRQPAARHVRTRAAAAVLPPPAWRDTASARASKRTAVQVFTVSKGSQRELVHTRQQQQQHQQQLAIRLQLRGPDGRVTPRLPPRSPFSIPHHLPTHTHTRTHTRTHTHAHTRSHTHTHARTTRAQASAWLTCARASSWTTSLRTRSRSRRACRSSTCSTLAATPSSASSCSAASSCTRSCPCGSRTAWRSSKTCPTGSPASRRSSRCAENVCVCVVLVVWCGVVWCLVLCAPVCAHVCLLPGKHTHSLVHTRGADAPMGAHMHTHTHTHTSPMHIHMHHVQHALAGARLVCGVVPRAALLPLCQGRRGRGQVHRAAAAHLPAARQRGARHGKGVWLEQRVLAGAGQACRAAATRTPRA